METIRNAPLILFYFTGALNYFSIEIICLLSYQIQCDIAENAGLNTKLTVIPELHYHIEAMLYNFAAGYRSTLKLYNTLNGTKSSKLYDIGFV